MGRPLRIQYPGAGITSHPEEMKERPSSIVKEIESGHRIQRIGVSMVKLWVLYRCEETASMAYN